MNLHRCLAAGLAMALGLVFVSGSTFGGDEPKKPKLSPEHEALIGKKAPEVPGEHSLNSKILNLSGYKGKVVLVDFWAVWCPPCKAAFPTLNQLHEEFKSQGFEVVGVTRYHQVYGFDKKTGALPRVGTVSKDDDGKVVIKGGLSKEQENSMLQDFAEYFKLSYPQIVLSAADWTKVVSSQYAVRGIPTAVLVDRTGTVRHIKVGFSAAKRDEIHADLSKLIRELVAEKK